jgi:FkbM family methyltransferase
MFSEFISENRLSFAQHNQDLLALYLSGMKQNGFFVEFGAMDGLELSNTLLLEKYYGWTGILSEPIPSLFNKIPNNRSAIADPRCVHSQSGLSVDFIQTKFQALSTLKEFSDHDHWASTRADGAVTIKVETVSLDDLLNQYDAPEVIDYLSIDTEGSEFIILNSFSFTRRFNLITAEHNHANHKEPLRNLLQEHGYKLIYPEYSDWEDWYVHEEVEEKNK